jgi:hypothetical protein
MKISTTKTMPTVASGATRGGGRGRRRRRRRFLRGLFHLPVEAAQHLGQATDGALLQARHLVPDGLLVAWQVGGEFRDLQADHGAKRQEDPKCHDHRRDHGRDAPEPPAAQQIDEGRDHEGEEHREDDRDEHLAAEIEAAEHDDGHREGHEARHAWRRGRRHLRVMGRGRDKRRFGHAGSPQGETRTSDLGRTSPAITCNRGERSLCRTQGRLHSRPESRLNEASGPMRTP